MDTNYDIFLIERTMAMKKILVSIIWIYGCTVSEKYSIAGKVIDD